MKFMNLIKAAEVYAGHKFSFYDSANIKIADSMGFPRRRHWRRLYSLPFQKSTFLNRNSAFVDKQRIIVWNTHQTQDDRTNTKSSKFPEKFFSFLACQSVVLGLLNESVTGTRATLIHESAVGMINEPFTTTMTDKVSPNASAMRFKVT